MLRNRHLGIVSSILFVTGVFAVIKIGAQTTPPVSTSLESIVVDDGKHTCDVVLQVDFDTTGSVAKLIPVSGSDDLYPTAERVTRFFRHASLASATSLTQTVHFWTTANGIKKTKPIYPPIARAAHVAGTVELVATISPDGHVNGVTPLSGPAMLLGSARDAIVQWTYPQILLRGVPVPFEVVVDINYKL
jgi:outer membrane biosynthesis protein TonB